MKLEPKIIPDYPNYTIDIDGTVTNIKSNRPVKHQVNQRRHLVELWKNNKKKHCLVHRLIAQAYIPNPNNLPQINHIDGNPSNNRLENLEWVTDRDNKLHAHRTGLINSRKTPVLQYTLDGTFIKEYSSILEANNITKIDRKSIKLNIEGKYKQAGKYIWKLKN